MLLKPKPQRKNTSTKVFEGKAEEVSRSNFSVQPEKIVTEKERTLGGIQESQSFGVIEMLYPKLLENFMRSQQVSAANPINALFRSNQP